MIMLSRSTKESQTVKLKEGLSRSKASFLVSCMGLNVEQMTKLRKSLKQNQGDIQILRNSLSLRAMESHSSLKSAYSPLMEGPNAFILAFEDTAKVAKIIDQFAGDHEVFKIKRAVFEGQVLSPNEVKSLASLPPLAELKSQFLGLLTSPLTQFLRTVKEPSQAFARLLAAKKESSK